MGAQQAEEFIDPPGRMTESPDCRWRRHGSVWQGEQRIATGSIRRQFFWIDFEQPESAVGDVLGFVEMIVQLHGSDEEIAAGHKREVAP